MIRVFFLLAVLLLASCRRDGLAAGTKQEKVKWRFAAVGDSHVPLNADIIEEMIPYLLADSIDLIIVCGDLVQAGKGTTRSELESQLLSWQAIFKPLHAAGIGVYPVRGNHENDARGSITGWNNVFKDDWLLPQNGPENELNLSYFLENKNALFVALDNYVQLHQVNQSWLDQILAANRLPHVFVFGHEPAFKAFHSDCLDSFPAERDQLWESLQKNGVRLYFCGHDHFFDVLQIADEDGQPDDDIFQCIVGGGGGWLMPRYNYNGQNSHFLPKPVYHRQAHGYALVEINDLEVTLTWKERTVTDSTVQYLPTSAVLHYLAK